MAFMPLREQHAIAEVIFALQVSPGITHADRGKLKSAHAKWQAQLPALRDQPTVALHVFSHGEQPPPPPVPPLDFVRYKSDGNIDWRLHIQDDRIIVNCLAYTRWQHIWTQARVLFAHVSEILEEATGIASASLQYVNVFSWNGPTEAYDSRLLLNEHSPCVPDSVLVHGPLWHLHQGWFSPIADPAGGRILDRMHIDAIADQHGLHLVKFENLLRFDFDGDSADRQVKPAFSTPPTLIDNSFDRLHDFAKQSLGNYLTADVQRTINLHAE